MKKNRNTGLNHQKFYCDFREQRYKNKCVFVTFVTRGFKKCSQEQLFSTPILTEWKSPLQILIIIKLTHDSFRKYVNNDILLNCGFPNQILPGTAKHIFPNTNIVPRKGYFGEFMKKPI